MSGDPRTGVPRGDDQLYLDGIRTENGEMVIDLHDAGQTLAHMALAMRTFWEGNASEGTNYVQTGVVHKGKTWNFVVYPAGKPTPHDLRRRAEAERDEALAELEKHRAAVRAGLALADELTSTAKSTRTSSLPHTRPGATERARLYDDLAAQLRTALAAPLAGQPTTDEETDRG